MPTASNSIINRNNSVFIHRGAMRWIAWMSLLYFNVDFIEEMIEAKDGRLLLRAAGQVRLRLTARPAESVPSVAKININV